MMKRLQRKCFLISAAAHSLLLLVVVIGSAFVSRRPPPPRDLPVLHVIPSRLIDELASGGGNPQAQPPPPSRERELPREQTQPVPTPPPKAVVPPPKPAPKPVETPAKPTPTPVQPAPNPEPVRTPTPPKPAPRTISVSKTLVTKKPDEARAERAQAEEKARQQRLAAAEALQNRVQNTLAGIKGSLSSPTAVEIPGPGGEAYANYRQVVQSVYDQAWIDPADVTNSRASVLVEVTIHRDGRVVNSRVLRRSGIRSLDKSVEDALDRVRLRGLPKFPEGAKDLQRVFRIEFNLQTKRLLG